jgi:hypothetical protein
VKCCKIWGEKAADRFRKSVGFQFARGQVDLNTMFPLMQFGIWALAEHSGWFSRLSAFLP